MILRRFDRKQDRYHVRIPTKLEHILNEIDKSVIIPEYQQNEKRAIAYELSYNRRTNKGM